MKDFSPAYGVVPVLITTFKQNKEIDWVAYDALIDWHVEQGVSGLFINCGSSESLFLTEDEALAIARAAVKRAEGRVNVLAGSTIYGPNGDTFEECIRLNIEKTRRMADTGVDGVFLTAPEVVPEDLESLDEPMLQYHLEIHDATDCPLYLYEIPRAPRSYKFSPEVFARLAQEERFIGIKDTSSRGKLPMAEGLAPVKAKLEATDNIKILQAHNKWILESLRMGCTGGCNTGANVASGVEAKMILHWEAGDDESAEILQDRLTRITEMVGYGYTVSVKIALRMMGLPIEPVARNRDVEFSAEQMGVIEEMVKLIQDTNAEFSP